MHEAKFMPPENLRPYVNTIMVMESSAINSHTNIPLYADGYPGLMYYTSTNGCFLLPRKKKLSELFLYGQTIDPVSLDIKGSFKLVVLQLYPFASQYLLNVNPKELNDDCYDLFQLKQINVTAYAEKLRATQVLEEWVAILSALTEELITYHKVPEDDQIQQAIALILEHRGQLSIKTIRDKVYLTERTFERKFNAQVGLSPKQFAKIIQFKSSLQQLTEENYNQLLDISYDSGFPDQSHFIRSFKKYTGKTPSEFLQEAH
ncbi:MAG: helix-turn-helix domain-containing protein [Maribacter sp.]